MEALADFVARVKDSLLVTNANEPDRAVVSRDVAPVGLLIACPLRVSNIARLTYRTDNSGELYQKADGSWHIQIAEDRFKNTAHLSKPNSIPSVHV